MTELYAECEGVVSIDFKSFLFRAENYKDLLEM